MINIFRITFLLSLIFTIDEGLLYDLNFRGYNAGESMLSIKKDSIDIESNYYLTSIIKTNKFLDRFYKIRDRVDVILNDEDFSIIKVEKNQTKVVKKQTSHLLNDQENLTASSNNKTISIPGRVFDPLGAIYYLRNQNIVVGRYFRLQPMIMIS